MSNVISFFEAKFRHDEVESRLDDPDDDFNRKFIQGEIECKAQGGRSLPGKGAPVHIFVMEDAKEVDALMRETSFDGVVCLSSGEPQEDYAYDCVWPIVVKVKPGSDPTFVSKALRQLADRIDSNPIQVAQQ